MARPRCAAGFTLIELLVAIGILAMVAVLGWRGLDSIVRSREVLNAQLEQSRGMQLTFAQMQSDCDHLAGSSAVTAGGKTLLNGRSYLSAETDRLMLVRQAVAEQQPQQLQVVTYRLVGGVLTRRESNGTRDLAVLDTLWQAARDDTDGGNASVVLLRGVDSMAMRGQRSLTGNTTPDWITLGAGSKTDDLAGLEVTLQLPGQAAGLSKVFLLGPG